MAALRASNDDLLCIRMRVLGLDKTEVARLWPSIVLDLQTSCAACSSRTQCDTDLKSLSPEGDGLDAQNWQDYCPNVATLNMLSSLFPAVRPMTPRKDS